MIQFTGNYRNRFLNYSIFNNYYSISINNINIECTIDTTPFKDIDLENACKMHIDMLCNELDEQDRLQQELNKPITQEEIQAEILLNQAEILANQNAQDEVLAEVLLNSLEVSANV